MTSLQWVVRAHYRRLLVGSTEQTCFYFANICYTPPPPPTHTHTHTPTPPPPPPPTQKNQNGGDRDDSYMYIFHLWSIPQCFSRESLSHDDVIKWKHFPCYWTFVRGIHRSPVNFSHKGQWRGVLMFSLICAWINGWVNNTVRLVIWDTSRPLWRHCNAKKCWT